jgi:hypothetical protein
MIMMNKQSSVNGPKLTASWVFLFAMALLPGLSSAAEWLAGLNLDGGTKPINVDENNLFAGAVYYF